MKPYTAGIQPKGEGWIKLNTNENPYPTDVRIEVDYHALRLYPDADSRALCEAIARRYDVAPENVFCGNGSDEVLALVFQAFFSGQELRLPETSYGFYPVWADMYQAKPVSIPLKNWEVDWERFRGNCIIANPNAPTGLAFAVKDIPAGGVVVIDEAYMDFADVPSAIELTKTYDNLLVVRTLSKAYSLAGLRAGFAIGHEALIQKLTEYKNCFNSYPLDALAQQIACEAIRKGPKVRQVIETRQWLKDQLPCLDSQANFVFWEVKNAKEMYEHLLANKILVRYWEHFPGHLRVSIGTREEMEEFLCCAKQMKQK